MTEDFSMPRPELQVVVMLLLACLPVGLIVYGRLIWLALKKGGRVKTDAVDLPDAMVTTVLVGFLVALVAKVAMHPPAGEPAKITAAQVLPNVVLFLGVLLLLIAFLYARRIDLRRFFGLHGLKMGRAFGLALGLIASALPLLFVVGAVTQHYLSADDAKEQDLVSLFRDVVGQMDVKSIATIVFAGALSQPLVEEVFFRGYFYVVGKRFFGGVASAVFTSALFAAVHLNLASFPALFVLALCLTLAYEVTGSILVPIGMHALFNSSQFAFLAWQVQSIQPQ
jgi:membrane protease YdiL (CAAX protease family)